MVVFADEWNVTIGTERLVLVKNVMVVSADELDVTDGVERLVLGKGVFIALVGKGCAVEFVFPLLGICKYLTSYLPIPRPSLYSHYSY